ncbi:MAG: Ig-like domain-containing protein [Microbacterium sp.]|uniref:Ig-like domain-containing protein n=1 Tax=Microbacterium sp. TaxID=51671 RepID=UPI0026147BBA|nr:Ig-like domain-containing protein [Microbacterium sp.]MCX6501563.1 Ig-like domain-containing protein [Microbacterium sp.]
MPNVFGLLLRHRAAVASGATLTAAAVTISTLAVLYQGIPTADVELDDGGVWVTKSTDLLVGHLNYPSRLLDGAARARAGQFDVLQDGPTVLVHDETNATVSVIDPALVEFGDAAPVPAGASVALGGTTVAVRSGSFLHVLSADSLSGAAFEEDAATADVGAGAGVAVSRDGSRVFAAGADAITIATVTGAVAQVSSSVALADVPTGAELAVTAVDEGGIAFDAETGVLYLSDGTPVAVPDGAGGVLQQSGADQDAVYLSTPTALVRQPLDGGPLEVVATVDEGTPAAPVWLNGCVYAVWSGSGAYVRDCLGDAEPTTKTIEVSSSSTLVLRANRRVVVVNDVNAGSVWIVDQDVEKVDNWNDVTPPADDDSEQDESEEEEPQYELPERSAQNNPPTAVDDEYGVRAGRSVVLPVTENDSDPDGDLLSATPAGGPPTGYTVAPVLGGSALQVAVPANASGTTSFTYQVDDGRGGTDEASVSLPVHDSSVNAAPEQRRVNTVQVEEGSSLSYGALDGWVDPDGDDFYLKQATVPTDDTITYRSNGVVEFSAASGSVGLIEVVLTVSDGRDESQGVLRVNVRPTGSLDPVANADRVTAVPGVPVTVSPLANDLSPSGEPLWLSKLDPVPGVTITPDYAAGTFEFAADAAGTYYVQYLVTAGPRSGIGLVRIDVLAGDAGAQPPVAVRDLALLPTGRDVLVDVLANDSDPAGGILVVQSAKAAAGAGVSVEVLNHSVLRVTDLAGLSSTIAIQYTVSNGTQSATGEVTVLPVALPEKLRPPVAVADSAVVRAGDIVTIPVLKNDYHPDGDTMVLSPELVETDAADPAAMFIAGESVRFQAGKTAGTVHATYQIEDSQQNRTAGYVTIQVLPADEGTNSPPRPKPVTARAVAGTVERIAIPLDGIDSDGDSVELVGVSSNPAMGRVTVGDSWLNYDAYPTAAGRDTFTYTVRDRLGATAESTVTVGVAAPGYENQAPYAAKDVVTVRPGRAVTVAVTANDSDPDGDSLALSGDLVVPSGVKASVAGGRVLVTAPGTTGDYTITYTITDDYGASAQGVLLLTVDADAALRAPIARDDRASIADIGDGLSVSVSVLDNDEDPDGTVSALEVTVASDAASVARDGTVSVPLDDAAQILRYAVTDEDGNVGQAFIFVPGTGTLVPTLLSTKPIVVDSGESVSIPLSDHVRVREGRTPRIATADSIRTSHSDGSAPIVDETTLQYTSAAGYFGADTVGVLVTDGTGPDDPEGLSAYVAIPITVRPAENQSPTLRNAAVTVAPGEEAATLNLTKLAFDPDEGDQQKLTFSISGAVPEGFAASTSGGTLTVSADADARAGATGQLVVEVSDGTTAPGKGTVTLTTVTSQRPFPVANDDVVAPADQGKTQSVDVLANDYNPFTDRGPLTIISARVDGGRGEAEVQGDRVSVTPAADFVGTMIVTYRIADATKAADRQVEGRILLTVQGKPDAPGTPTVTSIQDRTVVLSWAAPANNGAAITEYRVAAPQGYSKTCASTTCTLDGLTNNVDYTFTVRAVNVVGESQPSPASAPARPDARPDTPSAPTTVFGDKSITVNWVTPNSNGSPVLGYNLEIAPAPASGSLQKTAVTGNSLVWSGLENGVAYQVRVQAINRAPDPSEWSSYSATVVPAGVPDAPSTPTTTAATPVGAQAQIAVSWAPPANVNGDVVADYTLNVKRGGSTLKTIVTTATSQNVVVDANETDYTFSVTARNKAGSSAPSADSAPRRAAVAPGAPTNVTAVPGDTSVTVTFTPGAGNGNRAADITYRYRVDQSGAQGVASPGGTVIGGLANGSSYSVTVWAESSVEGVAKSGEASSAAVVPFGKPIISFQAVNRKDNAVEFVWNVNPNGRPITSTNAPAGGEGTLSWTATGLQPSQSYTLNLSYTNEAGTSVDSRTGQANDPPAPTQWSVKVDAADSCLEDSDNGASHFNGSTCTSTWAPKNSTQTATCWAQWSHKSTNGDYRWFRLTNNWYLSVYTTVGEAIPAGMPPC